MSRCLLERVHCKYLPHKSWIFLYVIVVLFFSNSLLQVIGWRKREKTSYWMRQPHIYTCWYSMVWRITSKKTQKKHERFIWKEKNKPEKIRRNACFWRCFNTVDRKWLTRQQRNTFIQNIVCPEYGKQGLVERGLLIMNQKWPRPHILSTYTHLNCVCRSTVYHLSTAVQVILITYKYKKKYHSASSVLVYVRMSADTDTFDRSPEKLYV